MQVAPHLENAGRRPVATAFAEVRPEDGRRLFQIRAGYQADFDASPTSSRARTCSGREESAQRQIQPFVADSIGQVRQAHPVFPPAHAPIAAAVASTVLRKKAGSAEKRRMELP